MRVGGRAFDLTKQEIETLMEGVQPEMIQKHAVEVSGQLFPPKQVLNHVTSWERTSFTTMEAQRVLARLGFVLTEVRSGLMRQVGEFVVDSARVSARQVVNAHGDFKFQRGFSSAMGITLRRLESRLDDFRKQMKAGELGPAEQVFFVHLDELRSEIEAECDRYWHDTGVDWRPVKPVVKEAVERRSQD